MMRLKTVSRHALYYAICIALAGPVLAQTDQAADAAMLAALRNDLRDVEEIMELDK